jgi:hypothetical protein
MREAVELGLRTIVRLRRAHCAWLDGLSGGQVLCKTGTVQAELDDGE